MSNFAFPAAEFPTNHETALSAERNAASDPTAAAFFAGKTVEIAAFPPVAPRETIGYRLAS